MTRTRKLLAHGTLARTAHSTLSPSLHCVEHVRQRALLRSPEREPCGRTCVDLAHQNLCFARGRKAAFGDSVRLDRGSQHQSDHGCDVCGQPEQQHSLRTGARCKGRRQATMSQSVARTARRSGRSRAPSSTSRQILRRHNSSRLSANASAGGALRSGVGHFRRVCPAAFNLWVGTTHGAGDAEGSVMPQAGPECLLSLRVDRQVARPAARTRAPPPSQCVITRPTQARNL